MPLILPGNVATATASTTYEVANSCRFNDGDSARLRLTPGSAATSSRKMTASFWCKRGSLGITGRIFNADTGSNQRDSLFFNSDDNLWLYINNGGDGNLKTTRVFRDPSAWYHIVLTIDTTQSTNTNRVKLYINGTQETSFQTGGDGIVYPDQNYDIIGFGQNGKEQTIGADTSGGNDDNEFDGYLAEFVFIDGLALAPTSFGEFDEDSPRIWKPIDVSGLTFGTNGFYLDFEASDNLGNDANGGTDWTETNLAATDQTTDTCTNNFCTCNPLDQTNTGGSSATMAEGNLKWTSSGNASSQNYMRATFGLTAGKWYFEAKMSNANSGTGFNIGVAGSDNDMNAGGSGNLNDSDPNTIWNNADSGNSQTRKDGSNVTTGLTTLAENQIVQIALDLDNQKFYVGIQGTWQNSADPAAGSNAPATVDANTTYLPAWSDNGYADQITLELNFGSPTFSISSGNADANGYGNFEYAVPSGYYSLCTKNLAEFGG